MTSICIYRASFRMNPLIVWDFTLHFAFPLVYKCLLLQSLVLLRLKLLLQIKFVFLGWEPPLKSRLRVILSILLYHIIDLAILEQLRVLVPHYLLSILLLLDFFGRVELISIIALNQLLLLIVTLILHALLIDWLALQIQNKVLAIVYLLFIRLFWRGVHHVNISGYL